MSRMMMFLAIDEDAGDRDAEQCGAEHDEMREG